MEKFTIDLQNGWQNLLVCDVSWNGDYQKKEIVYIHSYVLAELPL